MGLFDLFTKKKSSSDYAKDRLKLLLVSDRANCSPDIMEQIKNDIIEVILMQAAWIFRLRRPNLKADTEQFLHYMQTFQSKI